MELCLEVFSKLEMIVLSVTTNTNGTERRMKSKSKLLTPDDKIVKVRIATKSRRYWSELEIQNRKDKLKP